MSNWRYCMVSGSPTAFYIPVVDFSNLRMLEESMADWLIEMNWADPTALPPWCPGSRNDCSTGYNGSAIDSSFFSVKIHRYERGAEMIDLSSISLVRAFLFSYDESRQYGKQWQVLKLNNPKAWAAEDSTEMFLYARDTWDDLWSNPNAHTKWDDEYLRARIVQSQRMRQMELWEKSCCEPDVGNYGGTI